ncbi:MAG: NAD(P)-binding domain-containing protein [Chloroflexi bacterium]|nr:NAD(P)-binding domain-containing protein [Chloroflexota bacterium]MCY3583791.1 NAD(P)-binding domain-containing protein [Chloroflexota bacterium]MCY3716189.1 NAD(P)-binding domain-containing protein [Chloroflexota bacterium]MDE2650856.1 NAD(P)-binding domain-containing protein [Chloroflexota bacterium]MXV93151.1 hydroxyacid dehydrogenase [Chloroflexota bacterium]
MYKIWFEKSVPDDYRRHFESLADGISPVGHADRWHNLEHADAVMAGGNRYDATCMERAPKLLIIARTGIGYDKVDIAAASARHIAVVNAPDAPTVSTAEQAIALMFSVARRLKSVESALNAMLENGEARNIWGDYQALELQNKRLGLVGLGRIGGHVSGVARAIGMQVAAYDPYVSDEHFAALGVQRAQSLEALLGEADVVSLHLPLNKATYKLMNARRFAQMKASAVFINVSRGGHVDEAALVAALDSGRLFGAGLDVTDPEPPLAGNPLLGRHNVVITPHVASATIVGKRRLVMHALEQVLQTLRGEVPPHLINPEVWDAVRARWAERQG